MFSKIAKKRRLILCTVLLPAVFIFMLPAQVMAYDSTITITKDASNNIYVQNTSDDAPTLLADATDHTLYQVTLLENGKVDIAYNEGSDDFKHVVEAGVEVNTNEGHVLSNSGIIITNGSTGLIDTNEESGIIGANHGTVTTNYGKISQNDGTVSNNYGQVYSNTGDVTNQDGGISSPYPESVSSPIVENVSPSESTLRKEDMSRIAREGNYHMSLGLTPGSTFLFAACEMSDTDVNNQYLLVNAYAESQGNNRAYILLNQVLLPVMKPSASNNGSEQVLTWNNLKVKTPGPIYALCYSDEDKMYVIKGTVDANGTATFPGLILRSYINVTLFTLSI